MKVNLKKLIIAIALPFAAGFVGSLATTSAIPTWYAGLTKPYFNPPNWIFGPVWTFLYLLMGIALYHLLSAKNSKIKTIALRLFFIQLALNAIWSLLFFGLQNPLLAFFEIIVLWFAIAKTIFYAHKVKSLAGYLLIPYLLWVSFAAILNLNIILLN